MKNRISLQRAQIIVRDLLPVLKPHCIILEVAGSVKRECVSIGDIELVLIPRRIPEGGDSLFEKIETKMVAIPEFVRAAQSLGSIVKGKLSDGKYVQIIHKHSIYGEINIDIFMPRPDDFWRIYAIRVGSAEFAAKHYAARWRSMGWCGVPETGLRRLIDCENSNEGKVDKEGKAAKPVWKVVNPDGEKPPLWGSEADFFSWLNLPHVHPKFRS